MSSIDERINELERSIEEIIETVKIISDTEMLREIMAGLDDLENGRYNDYENVEELKKRLSA